MTRCRTMRGLIVRSVESELFPRQALTLAGHLHRCTACRITLAREARLAVMLDGLADTLPVDAAFFERVMDSLPEHPPQSHQQTARRRLRQGLKLAGMAALAIGTGAGVGAVWLTVRPTVYEPALPRFSPGETDGWVALLGSAAQWVRITADTLTFLGGSASFGGLALGALLVEVAVLTAITLGAASATLAIASRLRSRAF